jgi:hypothetical protein
VFSSSLVHPENIKSNRNNSRERVREQIKFGKVDNGCVAITISN